MRVQNNYWDAAIIGFYRCGATLEEIIGVTGLSAKKIQDILFDYFSTGFKFQNKVIHTK